MTTAFTLRSAAGLDPNPPSLAHSALVIIDAQNEYAASGNLALPAIDVALDRLAHLLAAARSAGSPIIHIAHQGPAGGFFDPATGGAFLPEAMPLPDETVITKSLPNSFAGTSLREHLRQLGDPPLVLAGFMTHMCVSSTARAALDAGLVTTVVADATATRSLPAAAGRDVVHAKHLQQASLAALADRFSVIVDAATLTTNP